MLFFHPHRELHNGSSSGASSEFPHFLLLETCAFGPGFGASLMCDVCLCGPVSSWGRDARLCAGRRWYRLEGGKAVEEGKEEGEKGGGGDAAMCKEVNQFDVCLFEYKVN
jgi:hypothetical protein